ncbi:MAG TPA: sigma-70 family RNA polymerase sigma factor [Spirochaetota bacterium]|nr:sigma-70 family RNA polymerase sigma factor [Spirochaetota bacterium]HPJ36214.1 sigma-70 family RNA polymerase sigma factor [Spirochaetota bacterium]
MNKDNLSDEQAVRKVQKGRSEYFRFIVERYSSRIFSIGMRFFFNSEDSADFTQEVFLKAFDKIESYREIAPFRFWLVKLAYNLGINMKKSLPAEHSPAEFVDAVYTGESPDETHMNNELREVLLSEINKLPERYRICLDFYFFFGLKYSEISEITGFPVNTIKSDVFRAKNILRDRLRGTLAEECYEM